MTAFDTTNLRLTVTVPAHGFIRVKMSCAIEGAATFPQILLGVMVGAAVSGRISPQITINGTALSTTRAVAVAEFTIAGLTPGSTVFDAAYGVEFLVAATNIRYGGPNNTTASDAWGGFQFEIWDPRPLPTAAPGAINGLITASTTANTNLSDVVQWRGTVVSVPTTAGVPNVNAKTWNDLTTVELPLVPTTAGRKLDVSAGGEAGLDWANVGSPTTVVGLSGTTVKTATDVETDTADIQARLPAALTAGGNIKADALALSGDTVAADNAESFFDGTGYAGTNNVIPTVTTTTNLTTNNDKTGYALSTAGILAIWHQLTSAIVTASTIGKLIVDNLNATVSSRSIAGDAMTLTSGERTSIGTAVWATTTRTLSSFGTLVADIWASATRTLSAFAFTVDTNANASETAIKAKTDQLVFTVANQVDANALAVPATADDAVLTAISNLNNLSSAQAQTAAAAALTAYDPPTRTEATADKDEVLLTVGDVPTNAELATALAGADDAVLTQLALVRVKTDHLTYTVADELDVNIKSVAGAEVGGDGSSGNEWGPA